MLGNGTLSHREGPLDAAEVSVTIARSEVTPWRPPRIEPGT
jgi:hypothetical protein